MIDGVSPLSEDWGDQDLALPHILARSLQDCAADPACAEAYPDIWTRLDVLLSALDEAPLTLEDGSDFAGQDLARLLRAVAGGDAEGVAFLPRLIDELERGETATLASLEARRSEEIPAGVDLEEFLTLDLGKAVNCNDRYATLDAGRTFERLRDFEIPELIVEPGFVIREILNCEPWGLTAESVPLPAPVTSDLRVLVSGGGVDAVTPAEWAVAAAEGLGNAELVLFPQSPHGASAKSPCGKSVTRAFFQDPDASPDLACLEDLRVDFAAPDDALLPAERETEE
jgi:pimeloyl-ACP methyl ester carboxylesterase